MMLKAREGDQKDCKLEQVEFHYKSKNRAWKHICSLVQSKQVTSTVKCHECIRTIRWFYPFYCHSKYPKRNPCFAISLYKSFNTITAPLALPTATEHCPCEPLWRTHRAAVMKNQLHPGVFRNLNSSFRKKYQIYARRDWKMEAGGRQKKKRVLSFLPFAFTTHSHCRSTTLTTSSALLPCPSLTFSFYQVPAHSWWKKNSNCTSCNHCRRSQGNKRKKNF